MVQAQNAAQPVSGAASEVMAETGETVERAALWGRAMWRAEPVRPVPMAEAAEAALASAAMGSLRLAELALVRPTQEASRSVEPRAVREAGGGAMEVVAPAPAVRAGLAPRLGIP